MHSNTVLCLNYSNTKCVTYLETNFALAQHHYLRSSDGLAFAAMLVEMHRTRGLKYEVDLFITQIVLQYVFIKSHKNQFRCLYYIFLF